MVSTHATPRPGRRLHGASLLALVLAVAVTLVSGPLADARPLGGGDGWVHDQPADLGPGVRFTSGRQPGPVTAMTVEVDPSAPVRFLPVVSSDRLDGGRETVSSMCHRANALACVNANFPVCPSCGDPFGGVVSDGELLRTPDPIQDQVSIIDGAWTSVPFEWSAELQALLPGGGPALSIDAINTRIVDDGIVLYSPRYGARTPAPPGAFELLVRAPEPLLTGGHRQQVEMLRTHNDGAAPIPADGLVLSGVGRGADELWAFVENYSATWVELHLDTPAGLSQSFSGHPVLLRDGARVNLDPGDPKVVNRHPRTLVGWNDEGRVWLVVVDGRQGHSRGMDLAEASEYLLSLGATEGMNLDGGGSSTMVTSCGDQHWCARNRPSDGQERRVWVGLAVVGPPPGQAAAMAAPTPPPPPPTTLPPTTVPVTTTTTVALPAPAVVAAESAAPVEAPNPVAVAPTTTAPPVTVAPALPPEVEAQPVTFEPVEVAAGFIEPPIPADPIRTLPPLAVALAAVAVAIEAAAVQRLVAEGRVPTWVTAGAADGVSRVRAGLPSTLETAHETVRWARRLRRSRRGTGAG